MRFRKLVPISFINPAYDAGFFDLGVGGLSVNPWLAAGVRWVGTIAEGAKSCRYRLHDGWYAVAADAPVLLAVGSRACRAVFSQRDL